MKITLAQALPVRNAISRRIQELLQERNRVAFAEAEKGEKYEAPSRNIDDVTTELREARADYRTLDVLVARENLKATVQWDGGEITLVEAIELAKQVRGEVKSLKDFGNRKKQERKSSNGWGSSESNVIIHALYDPEIYRKAALKSEREVNRLSMEIDKKNHSVEFEFENADKYI
ncbi:hypothetical protein U8V72_14510 [Priestia filamentosa]|uniref:hypothetical protein n=1 Tax=Priestia filamentosa TaxID=1402861 RepID=UPI000A53E11D